MTFSTAVVLQAIEHGYRNGFDIMDASGLPDGTVYPALRRLERGGLMTTTCPPPRPTVPRGSSGGTIASGVLKPGWACDNNAGIYFEGTEPTHFVATREGAGVYYVDLVEGEVVETAYETTLIAQCASGGLTIRIVFHLPLR